MDNMKLGKEHMDKIHEILEGEGKGPKILEKNGKNGKEDSIGINSKRKGKGDKKSSNFSSEVIKRAFEKLHK